jgi:bifunctional lysine-specific demethylase and histidyl-hydroxylase NO66
VHVWTRRQLADDLLRAAGRRLDADPALRASLELGVDPLDPGAAARLHTGIRAAVAAALDEVTDADLAAALAQRVRAAQRAEPIDVLAQQAAAADDETVWRPRRHLAPRWEDGPGPGTSTLVTRVARIEVPSEQRKAVTSVLDQRADAAELEPTVRRSLCLAGLLVPANSA